MVYSTPNITKEHQIHTCPINHLIQPNRCSGAWHCSSHPAMYDPSPHATRRWSLLLPRPAVDSVDVGVGKRGGGWAVHPTTQDVSTHTHMVFSPCSLYTYIKSPWKTNTMQLLLLCEISSTIIANKGRSPQTKTCLDLVSFNADEPRTNNLLPSIVPLFNRDPCNGLL